MSRGRYRINMAIEMLEKETPINSTPLTASRVLVVEDDVLIATLYAELLVEMGHVVCAIEMTETDAVAAANRYKPDLMIVDVGLRHSSGIAAVTRILQSGFVPHLFVTGDIRAVQAARPGAVVLQKPFRDRELAQAIQRALSAVPAT